MSAKPEKYAWRYLNHSSHPNAKIDIADENVNLVAVEAVAKGSEVTFNYNTTEWDMDAPFDDWSEPGSKVQGFKNLSPQAKLAVLPLAATHIVELHKASRL